MNTPTTIADEYHAELMSATQMRWDLAYLNGYIKADHPDISKKLEEILEQHAVKTKRPVTNSKGLTLTL